MQDAALLRGGTRRCWQIDFRLAQTCTRKLAVIGRSISRGAGIIVARLLGPGGTLVYATCTISRRENEERVAALLAEAGGEEVPALVLDDLGALAPQLRSTAEPRALQLRPDRDRTTGFFICRLRRHD